MLLGILQALGGLGVFILGMVIMVDGLHAGVGDGLHRVLTRFTRSPLSGALTGAVSTAVLQSSSATTIAAVGFVSAGVLSFPQALGIIYGANLGTTVTGWIVVLLGFKLKIGTLLLPLIFIGVLLRIFAKGRVAELGFALAGFGLIFLGISQMQQGMQGLEGMLAPEVFPDDTLWGRLQLVLLGVLITLITQSSSAGVAMMLALLYAGNVNFAQAAAVVIGMDLGTSVKALIATIGGRTDARRTGVSHLVFNILTVFIALLMLDPFIWAWQSMNGGSVEASAEIALVAFHSGFNLAAVVIMLPFAQPFTRFIQMLIPAKQGALTLSLDPILLREPAVALRAAYPEMLRLRTALDAQLRRLLSGDAAERAILSELQQLLDQMHNFLDAVELKPSDRRNRQVLARMMHAMDHLQRLHERCDEEPERAICASELSLLGPTVELLSDYLLREHPRAVDLEEAYQALLEQREVFRQQIISGITDDHFTVPEGTDQLEALRWMIRVMHHLLRIDHHLAMTELDSAQRAALSASL